MTYAELFFDLVFAFATTEIAGVLGEAPTLPAHLGVIAAPRIESPLIAQGSTGCLPQRRHPA